MALTIDEFLHGLQECGLSLETRVINGDTRLVLSGDQEVINRKQGIGKYIQANRSALIEALLASLPAPMALIDVSNLRSIPCHLSEYGLCSNQMIEQDERTWRMSPDGVLFCVECWQKRRIELAEKAIPWLIDRDQPTDLAERIKSIMDGPGYACCGGHDWVCDWTGALVCYHVIEAQTHEGVETRRRPAKIA